MNAAATSLQPATTLARHELFSVRAVGPVTIACESGELWVTEDGHPEDVILGAGERYTTRGTAPALIEALAESRLHVTPAGRVAAVDTGELITSAMVARANAWRGLRDTGCA